ncbi:PLP-dependent aminotransferase family protein [Paenibacillus methanolicus]|uniref:GntR family transcriptional regulator/MocR family aminotransferase n=1 Tax=Paenibacillus methanolicus TaxID=582686 RepID=A0A5S5C7R9_9BACL|nr:PLP-dependent aminotransferase family protein [Paenibacillus methanolicus]TYP74033.1 GntR family transcriptional regulator/MocR family aminotransferase [Paenibacillus methanolicus]
MEITLPQNDDQPLYRQLYGAIRGMILQGTLPDGTKLPSVKAMQLQLSMSKTPIETACHMLLEEGYLISKPRSGFYVVNPRFPMEIADRHDTVHRQAAPRLAARASAGGHSKVKPISMLDREEPIRNVIDFDLLAVDPRSLPVREWKAAIAAAIDEYGGTLHRYGDARGEEALRKQIADYLLVSRGARCSPEQVVIVGGIGASIRLLGRLLRDRPAGVAFESGGIAQVGAHFEQNGFTLHDISLHTGKLDGGAFSEMGVRAFYLTPSHRPSGQPLPYPARKALLQWANAEDAYLIEDDYEGEFRYAGRPVPSLKALDEEDRVIYLGTFSKAFSPALRIGYLVLPQRLLPELANEGSVLSPPSRIDQLAMALYMAQGNWYRQIRRMRLIYQKKRERLIELVHKRLSPHAVITGGGAGLYVELAIRAPGGASDWMQKAEQAGVRVYVGRMSRADRDNAKGGGNPDAAALVYLGFGGVDESQMEEGILRLGQAWFGMRTCDEC